MTTNLSSVSASTADTVSNATNSLCDSAITLSQKIVTPQMTGSQEETYISIDLFFILVICGVCILIVHLLITTKLHILPESIAIVFVGAAIGLFLKLVGNWRKEESLQPTAFFLVILPPIIFESGYNLHKGNFFQNIGSILVFAIIGTTISAGVIGGGLYLCGVGKLAYQLSILESFGFGSLISAVDPVATLAIFQALDVDPVLYMLVFGESILNDAVSIVLMTTVMGLDKPELAGHSTVWLCGHALGNFLLSFVASAAIGIGFALFSALLTKWVDLRRTPSLEVGMMLIFSYAPYCLAEGIKLSGIMAILFAGIVMSHYTHRNLSPITQITVQQTFRTVAFLAETVVFAYLGLAIFSFRHRVELPLVAWVLALVLVGRAANIFPLSFVLNFFREVKITGKNQIIMWFSGLRGAIAFALSLHLDGVTEETRQVLVTTTLIVVLFTVIIFGGGTMPMMKLVNWFWPSRKGKSINEAYNKMKKRRQDDAKRKSQSRKRTQQTDSSNSKGLYLSKTKELGDTVDSEATMSEYPVTDTETRKHSRREAVSQEESDVETGIHAATDDVKHAKTEIRNDKLSTLRGFMRIDARYLYPFFTRQLTSTEVSEAHRHMTELADLWSQNVRLSGSDERLSSTDNNVTIPATTSCRTNDNVPNGNSMDANHGDRIHLLTVDDDNEMDSEDELFQM